MIDAEKLCTYYNAKHGSHAKASSNRMQAAVAKANTLGLETQDIIDYENEHPFTDLCDGINQSASAILQWKTDKAAQATKEATERVQEGAELSGALNMIESVISQIIVNQTPEIIELMKKEAVTAIDKYAKQTYGPIEQPIKFVMPDWEPAENDCLDPTFQDVMTLAKLANASGAAGWPLLIGPAGTGKSHMASQIADALGVPFYSCNAVKEEHKLSGFIDANGNYRETEFYKAWTEGGVFCLDEMDASYAEALVDLNGALAGGTYPFPIGSKPRHPDFYFIATANTWGKGASREYVGRNEIDAATDNRFNPVVVDYNPTVEEHLTDNKDILKFIREFRAACAKAEILHITSYRQIQSLHGLQGNMDIKRAIQICVVRNLEAGDIHTISQHISDDNPYGKAFKELEKDMAEAEKAAREGRS